MTKKRLFTWAVSLFLIVPLLGLFYQKDIFLYSSTDELDCGYYEHLDPYLKIAIPDGCQGMTVTAYGWPSKAFAVEPQFYFAGQQNKLIPTARELRFFPGGIAVDLSIGVLVAMPFIVQLLMKHKTKSK